MRTLCRIAHDIAVPVVILLLLPLVLLWLAGIMFLQWFLNMEDWL